MDSKVKYPHWTRELRGKAKDETLTDVLVELLHCLATQVVTISASGQEVRLSIVEHWYLDDDEMLNVQFGELALDYLQAIEDPRSELVEKLFENIAQLDF
jgi:hypothetical protein